MDKKSRQSIEIEIRKLSDEIRKDITRQQIKEGIIPGVLDLNKVELMIEKWFELEKYYLNRIYYSLDEQADLEMSLFMVSNYLNWHDSLLVALSSASQQGNQERANEIDELIGSLEGAMKEIMKAMWSRDKIENDALK